MNICAISDLHGDLIDIYPCDLVLICGDIVPLNIQNSTKGTKKWFNTKFRQWAENLPCDKVIFIAGNHELGFPGHKIVYEKLFPKTSKIVYLCNSEYIYNYKEKEYKIFGTPYCQSFGNWAFMYNNETLNQVYNEILENLDILLAHDAPYGTSHILLQKDFYTGNHIGNRPLSEAIISKKPKYVFHGHLHSTNREFEILENSKVVNCSIKDELYRVVYNGLYLTI